MKENEEVQGEGQCTKDSDCSTGYVCVNGKCVPDIGSTDKENEAAD